MTEEMREELMELIFTYGSACEKFGKEVTNYWANKEQDCLKDIDDFLDKIQKPCYNSQAIKEENMTTKKRYLYEYSIEGAWERLTDTKTGKVIKGYPLSVEDVFFLLGINEQLDSEEMPDLDDDEYIEDV